MRYYDGKPPEVMTFGTAWQGANFEPIEKTTEVAPGIIALVSDAPGTRELKELSLAVNTADGLVRLNDLVDPRVRAADQEHRLKPYYSEIDQPSIDPELMIRMLIIGYCYDLRSERRLTQEVDLHLAYRWFCRLDLDDENHLKCLLFPHG
jgi:hypothetical protein